MASSSSLALVDQLIDALSQTSENESKSNPETTDDQPVKLGCKKDSVYVRQVLDDEKDTILPILDNVLNLAFSKFLNIPPKYKAGGASCRWCFDEIYVACLDHNSNAKSDKDIAIDHDHKTLQLSKMKHNPKTNVEYIGCLFAIHYGCIRNVSAIGVLPKYWKNGIASLLMNKFLDNDAFDKAIPGRGNITRDSLTTYPLSFHTKFYYKFGFRSQYLMYKMEYIIKKEDERLSIKDKMDKNVELRVIFGKSYLKQGKQSNMIGINKEYWIKTAIIDGDEKADGKKKDQENKGFIEQIQDICDKQYKGWNFNKFICNFIESRLNVDNFRNIIEDVLNCKDPKRKGGGGNIFGLFDCNISKWVGFCFCTYREPNALYVGFGITKNINYLEQMVIRLIEFATCVGCDMLKIGMCTNRIHAFDMLVNKFGFDYDCKHAMISMGRINNDDSQYDDFETQNACVLGD